MDILQRELSGRVRQTAPDSIQVTMKFSDAYHEIDFTLEARVSSREITGARAEFVRAPYDRCHDTAARLEKITGVTVAPGVWRTIAREVGGKEGCTHLYELTMAALRLAMQGFYSLQWEQLPPAERLPFLRRALAGECYIYSHPELPARFLLKG